MRFRVYPCAPCLKSGLECAYNAPRKRAKRSAHAGGSQPESRQSSGNNAGPSSSIHSGSFRPAATNDHASPESNSNSSTVGSIANGSITARLVSDGRYVNNHLWTAISNGSHAATGTPGSSTSTPRLNESDARSGVHAIYEENSRGDDTANGRSFLFGASQLPAETSPMMHFPVNHVVFLWQIYCANIDPVMKLSHAPSVQHIVLGQISRPLLSRNEQALTSAIYFVSVVSLRDDQCRKELQDSRANLILK